MDAFSMDISGAFREGEHVVAALSGGVDSVALFLLLVDLRDAGKIRLTAAHFDHMIRECSGEDGAFVKALCARKDVPVFFGKEDVPALAKREKKGIESAARDARYAFLFDVKRRISADVVALGHHSDDQAESVLMHAFRGAGITGLSGMRERAGEIVRPLIRFRKAALHGYVSSVGESFCEDYTNAICDTPRNALRLGVIPEIVKVYPGAVDAIVRLAEIAAREDDYLRRHTDAFMKKSVEKGPFGIRLSIEACPDEAILCRALSRLLPGQGASSIGAVSGLCNDGNGAVQLKSGCRAEVHGKWLYLLTDRKPPGNVEPLDDGASLMGIGRVYVKNAEPIPVRDDPMRQVLSKRALRGAVLRTRRPGDKIFPLGGPGMRKLSDYLIDKKIHRPLRDFLPLIAIGDEVLWAVGVGISERGKLIMGDEAMEIGFMPEKYDTEDIQCTNI